MPPIAFKGIHGVNNVTFLEVPFEMTIAKLRRVVAEKAGVVRPELVTITFNGSTLADESTVGTAGLVGASIVRVRVRAEPPPLPVATATSGGGTGAASATAAGASFVAQGAGGAGGTGAGAFSAGVGTGSAGAVPPSRGDGGGSGAAGVAAAGAASGVDTPQHTAASTADCGVVGSPVRQSSVDVLDSPGSEARLYPVHFKIDDRDCALDCSKLDRIDRVKKRLEVCTCLTVVLGVGGGVFRRAIVLPLLPLCLVALRVFQYLVGICSARIRLQSAGEMVRDEETVDSARLLKEVCVKVVVSHPAPREVLKEEKLTANCRICETPNALFLPRFFCTSCGYAIQGWAGGAGLSRTIAASPTRHVLCVRVCACVRDVAGPVPPLRICRVYLGN